MLLHFGLSLQPVKRRGFEYIVPSQPVPTGFVPLPAAKNTSNQPFSKNFFDAKNVIAM